MKIANDIRSPISVADNAYVSPPPIPVLTKGDVGFGRCPDLAANMMSSVREVLPRIQRC